jgi:hypothetical protein
MAVAMSGRIIKAAAVTREFGIADAKAVHVIAVVNRLPFSRSTGAGFFIRERDLPVWRAVIGEPQEKPRWAAGL